MKKAIFFALMIALQSCEPATAGQDRPEIPWYKEGELWTGKAWKDGMWIAMNTGFVVDWAQTRYIADHPEDHYETNTILGPHPTTKEVNLYFIGTIIEANAIYYFVPDDWKPLLSAIYIKQRYDAYTTNKELGVRLQF